VIPIYKLAPVTLRQQHQLGHSDKQGAVIICKPRFGTTATFQEGKDMADQNEAKTKTIGFLPKEKVQTLKGWDEYVDKSTKLSVLRTETQKAKNSVRDALKERLDEADDIDFVVEEDKIRVFRVFRKQQQARRTKSLDLSSSFREQRLEGRLETKGLDKSAIQAPLVECVSDEAEEPTPNLDPITEESPANLDPVTERLMAIMRAKER
jgi:hypothetical protein